MRRNFIASILLLAATGVALADASFDFRLSPGPRLVGTRADSSGSGRVAATLTGSTLSLTGSYQGLLGAPASAQLLMGSAPGVRGPKIADLTISAAASGTVSGSVKLNSVQLAAFRKGGLYVEIDSANAPEGDLWGWVLPPSE
ncbi:MAG TPA: CHRD domain-containing protein [Rhizomicrobium sp.]|nr:CHRD domain-containing protein [Rhizomicrobium sp.]